MKHTNDVIDCPSCGEKLKQASTPLAEIFINVIKPVFKDCHISWSWRDEKTQNEAFAEGKSKLSWPNSKHNNMGPNNIPLALALDLFRLNSNGMASWEWKYFNEIAQLLLTNAEPIKWGGQWTTLGDADHFELS